MPDRGRQAGRTSRARIARVSRPEDLGVAVDEAIVTEYVGLSLRLMDCWAAIDAEVQEQLCARLDYLWYAQMTEDDRIEADRRVARTTTNEAPHLLGNTRSAAELAR